MSVGLSKVPRGGDSPGKRHTLSPDAKPFHPNPPRHDVIPTLRITTLNVDSYSSTPSSKKLQKRKERVDEALIAIASRCDAIFTQETRDDGTTRHTLRSLGWKNFPNPNTTRINSGGTEIWLGPHIIARVRALPEIIVPGRIQSVLLIPNDEPCPIFSYPCMLLNNYLTCGNTAAACQSRLSEIRALSRFPRRPRYVVAGGDFNLTEHKSDTAGLDDHYSTTPEQRLAFKQCMESYGLKEVYQEHHTRFRGSSSSRLDRFYISHSLADRLLLEPRVTFPPYPHYPGSDSAFSDHCAIMLSFHNGKLEKGAREKIPHHIATHAHFLAQVRDEWNAIHGSLPRNPARRWCRFNKVIRQTGFRFMRNVDIEAKTRAESLTLGIHVLRCMRSDHPDRLTHARAAAARNPYLKDFLEEDIKETKVEGSLPMACVEDFVHCTFKVNPLLDPKFLRRRNPSIGPKQSEGFARGHLSHLNLEGGATVWEHEAIADTLKETWEPIWNRENPCPRKIARYLSRYHKRLKRVIPDISVELVSEVMSKARYSTTGPNGIPFSIYRDLVDIAAPLLCEYIRHLAEGGRANSSFNFSNLFFFPKDESLRPTNLRPISVANTDNRLVANVLRRLISPAIFEVLSPNQRAFMPGSQAFDAVNFFNAKLEEAAETGADYHVLLHDYSKAYDFISRDYLFAVLRKLGLPQWTLNILGVLFTDVKSFPILPKKHSVSIFMSNGLRQGCPLSPLLFNVCMDPLLTAIQALNPSLDSLAFCDDLALGSPSLSPLSDGAACVDAFNEVSGSSSNQSKIFLVSSSVVLPATVDRTFAPRWANMIQPASQAEHLGVLLGRDLSLPQVFRKSLDKLGKRVAYFMPQKGDMSVQSRVIVANTYMLPLLNYACSFFLMPPKVLKEVHRYLTEWIVPGRRFKLEYLMAPRTEVGIHQPLRDPWLINVSALLANKETPLEILTTTLSNPTARIVLDYLPSCTGPLRNTCTRMERHLEEARRVFTRICGTEPIPSTAQKTLYKVLKKDDTSHVLALARRFDPPDPEVRLGREMSLVLARSITSNYRELPKGLPSTLRYHAFELVYNAVPTRARESWRPDAQTICALCGGEGETIEHLQVSCTVSRRAKVGAAANKPKLSCLLSSGRDDYRFQTIISPTDRIVLLCFSLAVWRSRRSFLQRIPDIETAARAIARNFNNLHFSASKRHKHLSRRSRAEERKAFQKRLSTLPPSLRLFTDGSSLMQDASGQGTRIQDRGGLPDQNNHQHGNARGQRA